MDVYSLTRLFGVQVCMDFVQYQRLQFQSKVMSTLLPASKRVTLFLVQLNLLLTTSLGPRMTSKDADCRCIRCRYKRITLYSTDPVAESACG